MAEEPRQASRLDQAGRRAEPAFTLSRHISRVAAVFDAAPIGVGVWSMDGELLHANPVLCDLVRRDRPDLIGRLFESFIEPAHAPGIRRSVQDLWEARRNYFECDFRCTRTDGSDLWVRCHVAPIYGPGGAPEYLISQIFSFGVRGDADTELADLAALAPVPLWIADERGVPRQGNAAMFRLLGLPEGSRELRGFVTEAVHPDDLREARSSVERQVAAREPIDFVARIRRADGEWRWMRHSATPRVDPDGRLTSYAGVSEDVTGERSSRRELEHIQQLFRSVTEAGPIAVLRTDRSGNVTYANGRWADLLDDPETRLRRRDWQAVLVPEDVDEVLRLAEVSIESGEPFVVRVRTTEPVTPAAVNPGDVPVDESWGELRVAPVYDELGRHDGFVATVTDVSAEVAAGGRADRLARVLDAGSDFLVIADRGGSIVYLNDAAAAGLAVERPDPERGPSFLLEILDADSLQLFHDQVEPILQESGSWQGELTLRAVDGSEIVTDAHVLAERDNRGRVESFSVVARDIGDQKAVQAEVHAMATHDYLTGLPNRVQLYANLDHALARFMRYHTPMALLYLDLDRFKPVNDEFGHHVGDQVLKLVADRIHECTRDTDTAARVGGDEFAILVDGFGDLEQLRQVAQRLIDSVALPVPLPGGFQVTVGASIGVVVANEHCNDADDLMALADTAMYRAKSAGRGRYEILLPGPGSRRVHPLPDLERDRSVPGARPGGLPPGSAPPGSRPGER